MRHGIKGRKLNRRTEHRKSLFSNLASALIQHEQITTTLPKAKDLRVYVEKLVTKGKKPSLATFRTVAAQLGSNDLAKKLFEVLAKRYESRPGGYTRILKSGFRYGDNAAMAVIEFVDRDIAAKGTGPSAQGAINAEDTQAA